MKKALFTMLFLGWLAASAQDSLEVRKYQFGYYNQFDLHNSSINAISAHRFLHDAFRKEVQPVMSDKLGNAVYGVFSFATTYLTMLWSHEFGHSLRAKQVGGNFRIHNAALPIPKTTMHLPQSISLVDRALSVTAGFEVNALNTRSIQGDFISHNGICNEDLALSFANRLMYPLYASVIVPINPEEKDVWINTAGDPVHVALPVFENYSNGQVFLSDSIVNPELVKYYNQSSIFVLLMNLLDPQLYREVGATFGKNKRRSPIFLIGDHNRGYTYGTLFNVSPLGYELYMNNYLNLWDKEFTVYLKYGNPFKNNGVGVACKNFIDQGNLQVSAQVDAWSQDLFGNGLAGEVRAEMKATKHLGLFANAGYKSQGYVLGKQIAEGANLGVGLCFYSHY